VTQDRIQAFADCSSIRALAACISIPLPGQAAQITGEARVIAGDIVDIGPVSTHFNIPRQLFRYCRDSLAATHPRAVFLDLQRMFSRGALPRSFLRID